MNSPKNDAIQQARALLLAGGTGALSVIDVEGQQPFVTLVNVAVDDALSPLILISALSHHTKCLAQDSRGSLMLHAPIATDADPMLTFRVSLQGVFEKSEEESLLGIFLKRHPYAELYAGLGDFAIWRMQAEHAHIIAGFGRAYGVRYSDIEAA